MKICVFGLWHLGSVLSAGLAKIGHTVVGLDFNSETIESLQNAKAPVSEPGLNELILEHLQKNNLKYTFNPAIALADSDVLWIAFDTPVNEKDEADENFIKMNFNKISGFIRDQMKIIVSSQVPVGFTRQITKEFHEQYPNKKIFFAYSPENLRLGKSLKTLLEPDRIIIGIQPEEKNEFSPVFSPITDRLEWMGIESAEMTKHAINSFLATSVCFANEIATICEYVGADAKEVERGLKTEERIGPKAYLKPGSAFSGGTLARDIKFLKKLGSTNHLPLHLINSVDESNTFHKSWVKRKSHETLGELKGKNIFVLGLTYKPNTDTLRRSLSIELCMYLHDQGSSITAYDPMIDSLPPSLSKIIELSQNIENSVKKADCLIISTEWPVFQNKSEQIKKLAAGKIIIDPNGFLERDLGNDPSIRYYSVGRKMKVITGVCK